MYLAGIPGVGAEIVTRDVWNTYSITTTFDVRMRWLGHVSRVEEAWIACSSMFRSEDRKGREADEFEDLDVDGTVILNSFWKESRRRMCTEFVHERDR